MNTYKKLGIGLLSLLAFLSFALLIPKKAAAEVTVQSTADISKAVYTFVDRAHIKATFSDNSTVVYSDGQNDSNLDYGTDPSSFCKTGNPLNDINQHINGFDNSKVGAATVSANININVMVIPTGSIAGQCQHISTSITIVNPNNASSVLLDGNGSGGVTDVFKGGVYQPVSPDGLVLGLSSDSASCFGGSVVLLNSSKTSGTIYSLSTTNIGGSLASSDPGLSSYFNGSNCRIYGKVTSPINGTVGDSGTGSTGGSTSCDPTKTAPSGYTCSCNGDPAIGASCTLQPTTVTPPGGSGSGEACTSKVGGWSLTWLMCPVLDAANDLAISLMNLFENQLSFTVNPPKGGTTNPDGIQQNYITSSSDRSNLKQAWASFRDLATVFLVVVLLVMLVSQAISFGPFDAYSLRKLLPRLIAAIILMQVSWYLFVAVISGFNYIGNGIADLLYAPFGGPAKLSSFWVLLGHAIGTSSSAGAAIAAGNWITLLGIVVVGIAALPTVVITVLAAILALLVGLATLVFRRVLIILLLLLSPVALLAWILPGTQTYWKKWQDAFIKVLMMYPLIILLIASGRVFAWVSGNVASPLMALFLVSVGYFGPLFILPKSYRWGGDLMRQAGDTLTNGTRKFRGVYESPLKDWTGRQQKKMVDKWYQATPEGEEKGEVSRRARFRAGLIRGGVRTLGGRPLPTHRQTFQMLKEAADWKATELALREGKINNDFKEYQKRGLSIQQAKERIRDKYWPNADKMTKRAFLNWGKNTSSFMEFGQRKWRQGYSKDASGKWVPPKGGPWEDMAKSQDWVDALHGDQEFIRSIGQRLPRQMTFRSPKAGGPKAVDYLPGGAKYEQLAQEETVDEDGKRIPNPLHSPTMHSYLGQKGPDGQPTKEAQRTAELMADSEAFAKTIRQIEDPADMPKWRPEHTEEIAEITGELTSLKDAEGNNVEAPTLAADALKAFIVKETSTGPGQYAMQPLRGAHEEHIDGMFGKGFLAEQLTRPQTPITAASSDATPTEGAPAPAPAAASSSAAAHSTTATASAGEGPSTSTRTSGTATEGSSPTSGLGSSFGAGEGSRAPSMELKINHEALADTIEQSMRRGLKEGLKDIKQEVGPEGPRISGIETPGGVILPPGEAARSHERAPEDHPPSE